VLQQNGINFSHIFHNLDLVSQHRIAGSMVLMYSTRCASRHCRRNS